MNLSLLFVGINANIAQLFKTYLAESEEYYGVSIDTDTASAYDALLRIKDKPSGVVVLRYKEREDPAKESVFERTFRCVRELYSDQKIIVLTGSADRPAYLKDKGVAFIAESFSKKKAVSGLAKLLNGCSVSDLSRRKPSVNSLSDKTYSLRETSFS